MRVLQRQKPPSKSSEPAASEIAGPTFAIESLAKQVDAILVDDLRLHESFRKFPYPDPIKGWKAITIGWGYNLSANGLPEDICEFLLYTKVYEAEMDIKQMFNPSDHPFLSAEHYRILSNMRYQMGAGTFRTFGNMISAIHQGNMTLAVAEMIDSAWFIQSGERSKSLVKRWEKASV